MDITKEFVSVFLTYVSLQFDLHLLPLLHIPTNHSQAVLVCPHMIGCFNVEAGPSGVLSQHLYESYAGCGDGGPVKVFDG